MATILEYKSLKKFQIFKNLITLISCLKGDALQAMRGYDIVPKNYNSWLKKYGKFTTIKGSL